MSASTRIRFVLVGTQHPGNIGAAARAMKTMGLSRLVLVAPEQPLDEVAFRRSAGAEDVLGDAPVFATLAEAVADCRLVLGCTARARRVQLHEQRIGRGRIAISRILQEDTAEAGAQVGADESLDGDLAPFQRAARATALHLADGEDGRRPGDRLRRKGDGQREGKQRG